MYVVTAITMFTLVLLVSLPCLGAAVLWPSLRDPSADRELAYGLLMKELLPTGVMGLVAAAMLAGVMSTVGDNLNFGGQVMLNDIYRRWFVRNASERHYLIVGKLCMVVILGLAIAVVYNVRIIFNVAVFMLQLSAAELPANWAQWWWWRFNSKARIAASFGGGTIFVLVVLGPKLLVSQGWSWAQALVLPWWYGTFVVMGLTTVLWVLVALLTRPDPERTLVEFYKRAQPLGSWGPIVDLANRQTSSGDKAEGEWALIFKGFGIAGVGAASVMSFILSISNVFIGRYSRAGLWGTLFLVGILAFTRWTVKYLDKLQKRTAMKTSVQIVTDEAMNGAR